ncbi:MAG: winged helix-turn-helix domain-containing protein [Candidatus Thorarchaeota archaeon]
MLSFDRRAYLHWIRNVRRGLATRSEIIQVLSMDKWCSVSEIAGQVRVTAGTVLYHLRNMEREKVVERNPDGQGWKLGQVQQSSLVDFLKPTRLRKKRSK